MSDGVLVAVVGAAGLIVTAVVHGWSARRTMRRVESELETDSQSGVGSLVTTMSRNQEFIIGQIRVLDAKSDYGIKLGERVETKVDTHLAESAAIGDVVPLIAWVKSQMKGDADAPEVPVS